MLPVCSAVLPISSQAVEREIALWTTRDGREIPLDDMSDAHLANAARVLSAWRARLKKRDHDASLLRDLDDAIARFKVLLRQRRRSAKDRNAPQKGEQSKTPKRSAWPAKR
jgi:hypothetical protein